MVTLEAWIAFDEHMMRVSSETIEDKEKGGWKIFHLMAYILTKYDGTMSHCNGTFFKMPYSDKQGFNIFITQKYQCHQIHKQ